MNVLRVLIGWNKNGQENQKRYMLIESVDYCLSLQKIGREVWFWSAYGRKYMYLLRVIFDLEPLLPKTTAALAKSK